MIAFEWILISLQSREAPASRNSSATVSEDPKPSRFREPIALGSLLKSLFFRYDRPKKLIRSLQQQKLNSRYNRKRISHESK